MPKNTDLTKIGVLTGGGDCPGLNAVIRAVVKTAVSEYDIEAVGILDGYDGLVRDRMIPLSYDDVSGILTTGGTILGSSNTANPFRYYPPEDENAKPVDRSAECVENARKAGIDVLVCIGGDGTLSIAEHLQQKGLDCVGVPKTIDNDVCGTDVTFGFDTAVQIVTDAVDRLHTTAQSHHRVMVVETMGRYTGWLALVGGMAGGGDIILIPEIEYDLETVYEAIHQRGEMGRRFSIVVVAEGVKASGGEYVMRDHVEESHDPVRLGGIGVWLADAIEHATDIESRATVLGHLQRGGTPTARDRVLATRFGREAMVLAADSNFGCTVALQSEEIVTVPLEEVADRQRKVDPEGQLVKTARSVGTVFGDEGNLG
ncbi:MAG: 6-phosphofructokinase [Candidatus Brocadiia bacterium]